LDHQIVELLSRQGQCLHGHAVGTWWYATWIGAEKKRRSKSSGKKHTHTNLYPALTCSIVAFTSLSHPLIHLFAPPFCFHFHSFTLSPRHQITTIPPSIYIHTHTHCIYRERSTWRWGQRKHSSTWLSSWSH
jgi:hypothetical protein